MLSNKNRLIPPHDPPEDGAPGWLTSYSDMMTDLLAIFVILFSFAMVSRPVVVSRAAARQNTASAASVSAAASASEVRQSASSAAEAGRPPARPPPGRPFPARGPPTRNSTACTNPSAPISGGPGFPTV